MWRFGAVGADIGGGRAVLKVIENSPEDEAGAMLEVDLDESLDGYVRERASLVEIPKRLTLNEWQKTAVHEAVERDTVYNRVAAM